jgi:hypothetical protein
VRKYFLLTSEKIYFFLLTSDSIAIFAHYFQHTVLLEKYNIKKHHALNLLEEIAETSCSNYFNYLSQTNKGVNCNLNAIKRYITVA